MKTHSFHLWKQTYGHNNFLTTQVEGHRPNVKVSVIIPK